jgi:hypothetical protein
MAGVTFKARYDRMTKIVTTLVVAVLVTLPIIATRAGGVAVFIAFVSAAVLALSFAYSPRGYEIFGGAFRVKRLIGDVVFPLDELRYVRDATAADFRGCVRLWGSGGLFGYYGWFWSKALGRSRWYVTDRSKALVLAAGGKAILASPEDRDGFVAAIRPSDAVTLAIDPRPAGGIKIPLGILLAITAVV